MVCESSIENLVAAAVVVEREESVDLSGGAEDEDGGSSIRLIVLSLGEGLDMAAECCSLK